MPTFLTLLSTSSPPSPNNMFLSAATCVLTPILEDILMPTCNATSPTILAFSTRACTAPGENAVDIPRRKVPEGAVMAVVTPP